MDDSAIRQAILGQYRAALEMLGKAIEQCPEDLSLSTHGVNRFWHLAYHTVFYTHLYLHRNNEDFQPWSKHIPDSNFLNKPADAFAKADVQEYLALCRGELEDRVDAVRFEEPSGFPWLPFNKLELQFYNIRHLEHHTGQMIERVRVSTGSGVGWVRSA